MNKSQFAKDHTANTHNCTDPPKSNGGNESL